MIHVIGEALVDVVHRADGSRSEFPGGSPANVAVGLGRLGHDVTLSCQLGEDDRGRRVVAHLEESGVRLGPTSRTPGPTSTATARIDADGAADYVFDLRWDPELPELEADLLHSGSIAATLRPGAETVVALLERSRPDAIITFDPNARPVLTPDRRDAVGFVERAVAVADVVKVSDEDLGWLAPGENVSTTARRWLDPAAIVVVTRGGLGAMAVTRDVEIEVPAETVDVVDTVGAGDAFMSGLIADLSRTGLLAVEHRDALAAIDEDTLSGVVRTAARAAALTVGRPGAQPPTGAELWH